MDGRPPVLEIGRVLKPIAVRLDNLLWLLLLWLGEEGAQALAEEALHVYCTRSLNMTGICLVGDRTMLRRFDRCPRFARGTPGHGSPLEFKAWLEPKLRRSIWD
jgi:hypothetical protein